MSSEPKVTKRLEVDQDWIYRQLAIRGWTDADFGRAMGCTRNRAHQIRNERAWSLRVWAKVTKALQENPPIPGLEEVLIKEGHLRPSNGEATA